MPSTDVPFERTKPQPGGSECVRCFQERIMQWRDQTERKSILQEYCKFDVKKDAIFLVQNFNAQEVAEDLDYSLRAARSIR